MSREPQNGLLGRVALAAWAMLTVILVLVVVLLIFEMIDQGRTPFAVLLPVLVPLKA